MSASDVEPTDAGRGALSLPIEIVVAAIRSFGRFDGER